MAGIELGVVVVVGRKVGAGAAIVIERLSSNR